MHFYLKELTETGQVEEFLAELQQQLAQSYPIKLFTLSVIDMANQQARRMYSSQPDIYPVGGMKPFPDNFWTEQVITNAKPFIANTLSDIKKVFFDHAVIAQLELGAVINFPVIKNQKVIGTVNLLAQESAYQELTTEALETLYPWLVIALGEKE